MAKGRPGPRGPEKPRKTQENIGKQRKTKICRPKCPFPISANVYSQVYRLRKCPFPVLLGSGDGAGVAHEWCGVGVLPHLVALSGPRRKYS